MEVIGHSHPLKLIDLQLEFPKEEEDVNDDDDDKSDTLITKDFRCLCDRCGQDIDEYHRYYYKCIDSCDYSLHKFCAELPAMLKHPLHDAHPLILRQLVQRHPYRCDLCQRAYKDCEIGYECSQCDFTIDINCSVGKKENSFYHPSHSHPLASISKPILCECNACGKEHKGIFYTCIECSGYTIHSDCVFLPKKLLIQETTNDVFHHPHPLTLSWSFSRDDQRAKHYPQCRVCSNRFILGGHFWIYKCDKCWYYVHVDCATSRREPFMSIFSSPGLGKLTKNFKNAEYPHLLRMPFPDQSFSIPKHLFFEENGSRSSGIHEVNLEHIGHEHPLILVDDTTQSTSLKINTVLCHNPMKKIELLCNGCSKPIMSMPFYKCGHEDQHCNFALHEWCTRLPAEVKNHPGHPEHTLVLKPTNPRMFLNVFKCNMCDLLCNGFAYSCLQCHYYIDVSCGFIPQNITHDAHPNHLLSLGKDTVNPKDCRLCSRPVYSRFSFGCNICSFYLHPKCALFHLRIVTHKFDKHHPLKLSYGPVENHENEYICEICEDTLDPTFSFYHCDECDYSLHSGCAPIITRYEKAIPYNYVYPFLHIKFGGIHNLVGHHHPLLYLQGVDGECTLCSGTLAFSSIFKCVLCKFASHYLCQAKLSDSSDSPSRYNIPEYSPPAGFNIPEWY